jgi:hypothetical protein
MSVFTDPPAGTVAPFPPEREVCADLLDLLGIAVRNLRCVIA